MATSPTHFGFAILDFGLVQEDFSLLRQIFHSCLVSPSS